MSLRRAVADARKLERSLRYMERKGTQRIAENVAQDLAEEAFKIADDPTVGFVNRTGRLRASLRIEQARDVRGRFKSGKALVASTPYAAWVEFRARTIDKRRGPPYWFGEVMRRLRRRAQRRARKEAEKTLAVEAGKARSA